MGQAVAEFGSLHAGLSKIGQDEGDTNKCVTAVVGGGIDDSTIAFTTDDGTGFAHLGHHVHLSYRCGAIVAAVLLCHVAQTTCGAEVADGVSGGMLEHVVGHGHKGVFLAEHRSVLADEGQTVHIGVNHESHVMASLAHEVADFVEVFLQRFGIVGEVAGRLAVEQGHLRHAKLSEEFGNDDTTYGIDGIKCNGEVCTADGIHVDQFKVFDKFHMALVEGEVLGVASEVVDIDELIVVGVGAAYHFCGLNG